MSLAQSVASGLRSLPNTNKALAATQAAWRFFSNERVSLPALAQPILDYARQVSSSQLDAYALVMHDFSGIDFSRHESKADRIVLYRATDLGYFLQSALLVSDRTGKPIAPVYIGLEAADGVHSSRRARSLPRRRQIDELNRTFGYVESLDLSKPCVHIVDRQADSLLHLRRFVRCHRLFVIRSDEVRRVKLDGESLLLAEVEEKLEKEFRRVGQVEYQGRAGCQQYVAATRVVLKRLGRTRRRTKEQPEKRQWIKGKPIELRYIVSRVCDEQGQILATWRLWTNVETVSAAEIVRWYYFRWRIESFFKLLKSGGQNLEQWQQESAEAVAKRLMIVAQVCIIVWALAQSKRKEAAHIREFLIQISGRQMKRGTAYTTPALLAGMWQFLCLIDVLERHTTAELQELAQEFLKIIGSQTTFKDV